MQLLSADTNFPICFKDLLTSLSISDKSVLIYIVERVINNSCKGSLAKAVDTL